MNSTHGTSAQSPSLLCLASLYLGDNLPDALDLIDNLHTAVTEGTLPRVTTLSREEVMSLLQELIFVAQETVDELSSSAHARVAARHDVILRLVQKG